MIDIRGTTFVNKGAQLMTLAVVERLGAEYDLSIAPGPEAWSDRAELGLKQTLHHHRLPRWSSSAGNLVPREVRRRYGLTADVDISGVIDASGFAYSDSFTVWRSKREAIHASSWHRRGIPRVLLPQAFGPFERPASQRWARRAIGSADRIYARDSVSEAHLRELIGHDPKIRRCPDVTIGLRASRSARVPEDDFAVLVPNQKMISSGTVGLNAYVALMRQYGAYCRSIGLRPVTMVHELGDTALAEMVAGADMEIFGSEDPLILKYYLGKAQLVISSRFHALVGSLSQGVPTVSLGWSHKYRELMSDFDVLSNHATPSDDPSSIIDDVIPTATSNSFHDARNRLSLQVEEMWEDVEGVLRGPSA